ncbi:unnamed protein product [Leptidea sinapis]|uniref:Uncharacterized protein n=1 Tax=Leptidea sinapis TaxID=189913 RepID=A0A5E4QFI8_9NEOP|nr:unnamed protein product [Leptidea sinapis]
MNVAKRARQNRNSPITTVTTRRQGDPSTEVAHFPICHVPAHDDRFGTHCILVGYTGRSRIKCLKCKVHLIRCFG